MIKLTDILNEAYIGNKSDFDYEFGLALDRMGIPGKAIKKITKKGKRFEVRMSSYMSQKDTWEKIGKEIGANLVDFQKGSINVGLYESINEDCWKGYKQIGMKTKNGKEVPNCVPESVVKEESLNEASLTISIANIVDELFPKEFFWVYTPQDKERVKSVISDLVRTLNNFYKKQNIKVRFTDTNFKMKMYSKESVNEELSSSDRVELYKLYSKAMKLMPQSQKQKDVIKQINVLRTKAGMKPLKEVTLNEVGLWTIDKYMTNSALVPGRFQTVRNDKEKEKKRAVERDLAQHLNSFWKKWSIPYRIDLNKKPYPNQNEDLRNWFGKGKTGSKDGGGWDRYNTSGEKVGKCGDAKEGEPYAACLSQEKAKKLGKDGIAAFVKRKRAAQKKAGDAKKGGEQKKGQKPTFVKTGA